MPGRRRLGLHRRWRSDRTGCSAWVAVHGADHRVWKEATDFANQQAVAFDKKLLTDLQGTGMTPIQPGVPASQMAVQPALQEMMRICFLGE